MSFCLPILPLMLAPGHDSTSWSRLDEELAAFARVQNVEHADASVPVVSGWIRTRYANSNDVDADTAPGDQNLGGFNLDNARLILSGEAAEGYTYTISMEAGDALTDDAAGPGVGLLDAFVSVALTDTISVSIGRFGATTLWSTFIEERNLMFLDRSFIGEALDGRDVGVEFSGSFDRMNWWASAQNGSDGQGNDMAWAVRASYHILGDSFCTREGTCGLGDAEHLTVGAEWIDDTGVDNGTILLGDVFYANKGWSAVAEIADFDDDLRPGTTINPATGVVIPGAAAVTGAQTAWNVALGYMFVPDQWEAAARYQDLDDDDDTSVITLAVNRYVAGHNVKWTGQFDTSHSDNDALESDTIAVGLTVGF